MTTVIKIGDRVTWRPRSKRITWQAGKSNKRRIFTGCRVLHLQDHEGRAIALIDTGPEWAAMYAYVEDLELDEKPDKTTILSGG